MNHVIVISWPCAGCRGAGKKDTYIVVRDPDLLRHYEYQSFLSDPFDRDRDMRAEEVSVIFRRGERVP